MGNYKYDKPQSHVSLLHVEGRSVCFNENARDYTHVYYAEGQTIYFFEGGGQLPKNAVKMLK